MTSRARKLKIDKVVRRQIVERTTAEINWYAQQDFFKCSKGFVQAWVQFDVQFDAEKQPFPTIPKRHLSDLCRRAQQEPGVMELAQYQTRTREEAGVKLPGELVNLMQDARCGKLDTIGSTRGRPERTWVRNLIFYMVAKRLINEQAGDDAPADMTLTGGTRGTADPEKLRDMKESVARILHEASTRADVITVSEKTLKNMLGTPTLIDEFERWVSLDAANCFDDLNGERRV